MTPSESKGAEPSPPSPSDAASTPEFELRVVHPAEDGVGFVSKVTLAGGVAQVSGGTCHSPLFLASSNGRDFYSRGTPNTPGLRQHLVLEDRVVVVGEYGMIAVSSDHGASWRGAQQGTSGCLYCVLRVGADELLAAGDGGVVLRSTDRGDSWVRAHEGGGRILSGLVVGPDEVYFVGDALSRWDGTSLVELPVALDAPLCAMTRVGGRLVAVGDAGQIWRSTEGTSWQRVAAPVEESLEDVAPVGAGLLAVGEEGVAIWSSDAGATFTALDLPTSTHLWSVAPVGEGALLGADDGEVLHLRRVGEPDPFADQEDRFDVPGRFEAFFSGEPDAFLEGPFAEYLRSAAGADADPALDDDALDDDELDEDDDEQDAEDPVSARGRAAYELLRPNGSAADYEAWWGQPQPVELGALRQAIERIDPDAYLYEWSTDVDVWPALPEDLNLFELLVHRDQWAYLGTGLVEAFAGVTCLGSLGNGDTYHLEVHANDSERNRVFLFDHETHTLEGPIADSLGSQVYLAALGEARTEMRRRGFTEAVVKLSGRIAPPWHFRSTIARAGAELEEYEPSAYTPLYWHHRTRWILYFLRADGVVDIDDLGETFLERFNPPLSDAQHEKWLVGARRFAPTALYLIWRCYLFGSPRLEEYLAIGRAHASRLVRDCARLVDELLGSRNHLGKIADMDAALARLRALDIDPDRAEARAAERAAARAAREKAAAAAARRVATLDADTLAALAWEHLDDQLLHAAIDARMRELPELAEAYALVDFVAQSGWHHDGLILEHERDEACDAFAERGDARLLPLLVGPLARDPSPTIEGEEGEQGDATASKLVGEGAAVPFLVRWARLRPLDARVGAALTPRLATSLDKYEHRRTAIVRVLGAMKHSPATDAIAALLGACPMIDEDHAYIRHEDLVKVSLEALGELGAREHSAEIARVLGEVDSNYRSVRAAAASALARLGASDYLDVLLAQLAGDLETRDRAVLVFAAAALAGSRRDETIAALRALAIEGPLFLELARDCALAGLGVAPAEMGARVERALREAAYDDEWTELFIEWGLRGLPFVPEVPAELALPFAFRDNEEIRRSAVRALEARGVTPPPTRRITRGDVRAMSDAELFAVLEADDTLYAYNVCFEVEARGLASARPSLVTYARRLLAYVHEGERDLPRDVAYPLRWVVRALTRLGLDEPSAAFCNELLLHSSRAVKDPVLREPPAHPALTQGMKAVRAEKWGWQERTAREWLEAMSAG